MEAQKLECLCPFCEEVFDLNEALLHEDEDGSEAAICPICEEAIPLEEIGTFLRSVGAAVKTGVTAWRKMRQQRKQMKLAGMKYKRAKLGGSLAKQRLKGKEQLAKEAGDTAAAEKYKSQRQDLKTKMRFQKAKHKATMGKEKERMQRVQQGISTQTAQAAAGPQAAHVRPDVEQKKAKVRFKATQQTTGATKNEALAEAIRRYWDEGETLPNIQRYLAEEVCLLPEDIHRVTLEIGRAIRNFDSDLDSKTVISMLYG